MLVFLKSQLTTLPLKFYCWLLGLCLLIVVLGNLSKSSFLEIFVAILGIWYALFAGKGKALCFIFGILYSLLYAYIAFGASLYGDMMLQFIFLPINLFGFFSWMKFQDPIENKILIRSLSRYQWIVCSLCIGILALCYGFILARLESSFAYWNALSVVLQIVAFCLQVKRYVQNYFFVTLANLISVGMWMILSVKDLNNLPQLLNMFVFLGIGIYCWGEWRKDLQVWEQKR